MILKSLNGSSTWNQTDTIAGNQTSVGNQTDSGAQSNLWDQTTSTNQTPIVNSTSSSTNDLVLWVPYLSLVCLIAVLTGLAISFYAHMARVKRRRSNAKDYVEKEIDLNRKRLFGMMRAQFFKQNSLDILDADGGDSVHTSRHLWTQYDHAYSFDEDYFQDNMIVPQFKNSYCPCQGMHRSLDNSDYFQKFPNVNVSTNKITKHRGTGFPRTGAGDVSTCRCFNRGLMDVNTFCCQGCKDRSISQASQNHRCHSVPQLPHHSSCHSPHASNLPPHTPHHHPPHHHHCCCQYVCPCLTKKESMSKPKRSTRKSKTDENYENDINNTLWQNGNNDNTNNNQNNNKHCTHYHNSPVENCEEDCYQNRHHRSCTEDYAYKQPQTSRQSQHNGESGCIHNVNKPERRSNLDSPLPGNRTSNSLRYKKGKSFFQQPRAHIPEMESPISLSTLNSETNIRDRKCSDTSNPSPLLNVIHPYRKTSEESLGNVSTSRKSDSELYGISTCTIDNLVLNQQTNGSSLQDQRSKSETCLTMIGKDCDGENDDGNKKNHSRFKGYHENDDNGDDITGAFGGQNEGRLFNVPDSISNHFAHGVRSASPNYASKSSLQSERGIPDEVHSTLRNNIDNDNDNNDIERVSARQSFTNGDRPDSTAPLAEITLHPTPTPPLHPPTDYNNTITNSPLSAIDNQQILHSPSNTDRHKKSFFFPTNNKPSHQKLTKQQTLKGEINPNFSHEPSDPITTVSLKHFDREALSLERTPSTDKPLLTNAASFDSKDEEDINAERLNTVTNKKKTKKKLSFFKGKKRPGEKINVNNVDKQNGGGSIFVSSSSKDDSSFDLVWSPDPSFTAEVPLRFVKRSAAVPNGQEERKTYINHEVKTDVV